MRMRGGIATDKLGKRILVKEDNSKKIDLVDRLVAGQKVELNKEQVQRTEILPAAYVGRADKIIHNAKKPSKYEFELPVHYTERELSSWLFRRCGGDPDRAKRYVRFFKIILVECGLNTIDELIKKLESENIR